MQEHNDYTNLIRALAQPEEDTITCAACEAQLADYVYALVEQGEEAVAQQAEWQTLVHHLAGCPHCTAHCAELRAMTAAFYADAAAFAFNSDTLLSAADEPTKQMSAQPDLSFLDQADSVVSSTEKQPIARHWWQTAGQLWIALSEQLLAPLQPGFHLQPATSGLKADSDDQTGTTVQQAEIIDETNPQAIAAVTIDVHYPAATQERERCSVEVTIIVPNRAPLSLNGIAVTLQSTETALATEWTDALGRVVFTEVPVAQLMHLYCVIAPPA